MLVADTVAAGKTPVQALAAVLIFFAPGHSNCLNLDLPAPEAPLLPFNSHGYSSFTYQACTHGVVFSSKLPLSDAEGTLMAEARDVTRQEVRRQCK